MKKYAIKFSIKKEECKSTYELKVLRLFNMVAGEKYILREAKMRKLYRIINTVKELKPYQGIFFHAENIYFVVNTSDYSSYSETTLGISDSPYIEPHHTLYDGIDTVDRVTIYLWGGFPANDYIILKGVTREEIKILQRVMNTLFSSPAFNTIKFMEKENDTPSKGESIILI